LEFLPLLESLCLFFSPFPLPQTIWEAEMTSVRGACECGMSMGWGVNE